MHALRDFFSTDYGLLSFVVIVFTLGMGVFFQRFIAANIRKDTAAAAAAAKESQHKA